MNPSFFVIFAFLSLLLPVTAMADDKIVICRPSNMVSALVYIADKEGFFRDEKLDAEILTASSGKLCQDNAVAGKADIAVVGEANFTYLGFNPHDLVLVSQLQKNPEVALIGRKDAGIGVGSDLRGKKIGYLPASWSYFYLSRLLDKLKISPTHVQLFALQPQAMPAALQGKVIDAFVMWEPWASQALKSLGDNGIRLKDTNLNNYGILVVRKELVVDQPQAVSKLLKALLRAEDFIKNKIRNEVGQFLFSQTRRRPMILPVLIEV
jgi:NitT/TauT family transport system substrate-binding protein